MESNENVERLLALCDEFMNSKILFADKKMSRILELIASTGELYELMSECLGEFDKEKEYERAFTRDAAGNNMFVMPKEEYKILALVFCLMADIVAGRIKFDELIEGYFKENGKIDTPLFMRTVIKPFRDLIADAFNSHPQEEEDEEDGPLTPEQIEELPDELRLKIVPFPIQRTSGYLKDPDGMCRVFVLVKDTAIEMLDRIAEERPSELTEDVTMMLHCVIIACIEQDFDLLNGLVIGLKYVGKQIRSLRHLIRELEEIVRAQIREELK